MDGCDDQLNAPVALPPRKEGPLPIAQVDAQDPRAGLNMITKRETIK